jgi:hypothetical protein
MSKSPEWRFLTVDHILPRSQARRCTEFGLDGVDDKRNLVTACRYCNNIQNRWRVPGDVSAILDAFRRKASVIQGTRESLDKWWQLRLRGCKPD